MKLVQLSRSGGGTVWVNPLNVVDVTLYAKGGDHTYIVTNVPSGDSTYRIVVDETPAQVAQMISDELATLR